MKLLLSLTAAVFLFSSMPAKAGLLLEPYLGIINQAGKYTGNISGIDIPYPLTGNLTGFGARVGYSLPMFFVAADYSMLSGKTKFETASFSVGGLAMTSTVNPTDWDTNHTIMGLTAGVSVPMFRFYLGYNFDHKATFKGTHSNGTQYENTFSGGTSYKIGAGYTGLPLVAINLEYWMTSFGKYKNINGVEYTIGGDGVFEKKVEFGGIGLNLSAPFDL